MSLLKKLFGFGGVAKSEPKPPPTEDHKGYVIAATPMSVGHEFQVCGVISKESDGVRREKQFIRVDRFSSRDDALSLTFQKGRQIIDQMGDRLFD